MSRRTQPTFTCRHCGKMHTWERGIAGLAVRCACGEMVHVPASRPNASELEIDLGEADAPPKRDRRGSAAREPRGPAIWDSGEGPGGIGASAGRRSHDADPFELAEPGATPDRPPARERDQRRGADHKRKRDAKAPKNSGGDQSQERGAFELADEREAPAEPAVQCPSCGTDIPGGQRVCGRCGLNLITGEHVGRKKKRRSKIAEQAATEAGAATEADTAPAPQAEPEAVEGEEDEEPRVLHEVSRLDVLKLREIPIGVLIGGAALLVILSWVQAAAPGYEGGALTRTVENLSGVVVGAGILAVACMLMGYVADVDFGPVGSAMLKVASAFVGGAALGTLAALPLGAWGMVLGFPVMILVTGGLLMWMFEIGPGSVVIAAAVSALLGLFVSALLDVRVIFPFL